MTDESGGRHRARDAAEVIADASELRRMTQAILDTHIALAATEECALCHVPADECEHRRWAFRVIREYEYKWLPTRRPGATRPEAIASGNTYNGFAA